ncbi:MAG: hypothetical protein ACR2GQ_02635 [Gemmatimonadota bacterium]
MNLTRRPLTDPERERLRFQLEDLRGRARRGRSASWGVVSGAVLILYLLTLLVSEAAPLWITLFWLAFGVGLFFWVRRDFRRDAGWMQVMAASVESALRRGEADAIDVDAVAYAEFEEYEDEGACWAFDLGDGRLLFVRGQEYYRDDDFPSLEFSIVAALDESGAVALEWVESHAPPSPPAVVVPAETKWEMAERLPGNLEVVRGTLADFTRARPQST